MKRLLCRSGKGERWLRWKAGDGKEWSCSDFALKAEPIGYAAWMWWNGYRVGENE